ncbi:hypothetical protein KQI63_07820 [bacterium]|nr:hypothetical protein [bacterium]
MNTGQSLLTLGALMLITITILNFNRTMNNIDSTLDYNRFRLEALSVMTSHVEQASQYFFDEASTDTTSQKLLTDFANPNQLGFEANDSSEVDDLDDLNGVVVSDTGRSGVIYNVLYEVDYVTLSGNTVTKVASRQYHKQVTLKVYDTYDPPLIFTEQSGTKLRDTLNVSFVISYWFYN